MINFISNPSRDCLYAGVMAADSSPEIPSTDPRFAYPVCLDLHDVDVLVVGGGRIAARKAADLARAGARVRLVATEVSDHVEVAVLEEVRERPFTPVDLTGVRLVVSATGDAAVDRWVADTATKQNLWVNAADQPADCSFILPAIARQGRVSAAVSTDGASPALAKRLRDEIGELLGERVARAADVLAEERAAVRAAGGSTEDVDWSGRLDELLR